MRTRLNDYGIKESSSGYAKFLNRRKREQALLKELEPADPQPVDLTGLDQLIEQYRSTTPVKGPTMNNNDHRLVWIDVETCGLNPQTNPLLEINLIITPMDGNPGPSSAFHQCIHLPETTLLSGISEWALKHHTANGLLNACRGEDPNDPAIPLRDADIKLAAWLDRYENITLHPAGTNVNFDLRFLKHNLAASLPNIKQWSHRHLDLSTFRLTDMALGQDPYDSSHETTHRGLDCLNRDLEDYKRYRRRLNPKWKKAA